MTEIQAPGFLDTSYVVRYLTNSPPDMAAQATRIIDSDQILVLSELALSETAYVLASVYGVARPVLVDALMRLVQRRNLQMADLSKARVLEALRLCRDSKRVSITDALLWAQACERGATTMYTFDRRFPSEGLTKIGMS
jgi:predicted nucleic acid-binding protein